eukprot:5971898-Prymnesium_polylepis.2
MPPRRAGATPRERTERAHWPSGVRTISGCAYAASSASLHEGKRCQHLPARTRPARPRRWWADCRAQIRARDASCDALRVQPDGHMVRVSPADGHGA